MTTEQFVPVTLPSAEGNRALLQQGAAALERLSSELYSGARPGHSSVGAQFRHILDHYAALFGGLQDRRVNYDARRRDRTLEEDPAAAAATARQWMHALATLDASTGNVRLEVHSDSGGAEGQPDWRESTVGRELQFLASHTVHHYAVIKLLLERDGVPLDDDFGMAPSTRAHLTRTG